MHSFEFRSLLYLYVIAVSTTFFWNGVSGLKNKTQQPGNNKSCNEYEYKMKMVLYKQKNRTFIPYTVNLCQSVNLINYIDLKKPFVFYIHGFSEKLEDESIRTIVSAYLRRGADNIVVLNWTALAFDDYLTVHSRMQNISKNVAKAIQSLVNKGLKSSKIHIIGHSMGAHVAGFMGKYLKFQIPRITGLDPASPLFYQFGAEHLNKKSALQVDVIHTDGGMYGAYGSTGSADFYPNGGVRPQPGCYQIGGVLTKEDLCSHYRSWRYYAESVNNEKAFPARNCIFHFFFLIGLCQYNEFVYLGYALPKNITGTFYLETNYTSPFGRGMEGI